MSLRLTRRQYADLYGPTTGDRVRLADTELLIRVERDLTVPGEEAKFGGGKVIRDGMGQSARATRADGALEAQGAIRLEEVKVRADLDGPVARVLDGQFERPPPRVGFDGAVGQEVFGGNHAWPPSGSRSR